MSKKNNMQGSEGKENNGKVNKPNKAFDKDSAIFNPAVYFNSPVQIITEQNLTKNEKVKALKNWELDIRLNEIAVEENMPTFLNPRKNVVTLQEVHLALEKLGIILGPRSPTSKTGM